MSIPHSSSQSMASQSDASFSIAESFGKYTELWLGEQRQFLKELISAADSSSRSDSELQSLTGRVLRHYKQYQLAKSRSARDDVLAVLAPPWLSPLESAFLWIGGWRPTACFHLLYSKAGLQFEARFGDLVRGVRTGDLGDLSMSQLGRVDALHRGAVKEEKKIAEAMAEHQETVADSSMVQMSCAMTELVRSGESSGWESLEDRVTSVMAIKEEALREILQRADDLRLRTLQGLIDVLTPIQAVHFLIAAAELHISVHEWGKKRDGPAQTQARDQAH